MPLSTLLQGAKKAFHIVFLQHVFNEEATLGDLLQLVVILAIVVNASFTLFRPFFDRLANGPLKEKFVAVSKREFNRPDKRQEQALFGVTKEEEYLEIMVLGFWPEMMLILTQHLVGGILTIPSVLRLDGFSANVSGSLACLGILLEMGYEVQDMARMLFCRVFQGKEGEKQYPNSVVVVLCLHHSLTSIMGLPMVMKYRNLPELHRMCFDLQLAGAITGYIGEFSRMLDVTKFRELFLFTALSLLAFVVILWTRLFDWVYLSFRLVSLFYKEGEWLFLGFGGVVLTAFSIFNLFLAVIPVTKRVMKFGQKLYVHESLPDHADERLRRSTVADLQMAAAELIETEKSLDDVILNRILFEDRVVERRHSLNFGSLRKSTPLGRRSSFVRNRHSMVAWKSLPSEESEQKGSKMD